MNYFIIWSQNEEVELLIARYRVHFLTCFIWTHHLILITLQMFFLIYYLLIRLE